MDDLISRQELLKSIEAISVKGNTLDDDWVYRFIQEFPSAQPNLDEFCTDCKEYDTEHNCCPRFNRVIRTALQDAQLEQRWIPCSERLPEERKMVLVTIWGSDIIVPKSGETVLDAVQRTMSDPKYVKTGFIEEDEWYGADYFPMIIEPVAWMPFPLAYQGEEDAH